jgi:hypothetical protein
MPKPSRNAERLVITLVERGELAVDFEGRVWRFGARRGRGRGSSGSHVISCSPRRAEHLTTTGYLQVRAVVGGGERVHALAHRLMWHHFNGPIPDGLTVNHVDGVKTNNRPGNLELATDAEQTAHALALGLRSFQQDRMGRIVGKKAAGRELDGREWSEMPRTSSSAFVSQQVTFGVPEFRP